MVLLVDVGNSHVHCGLGDQRGVRRRVDFNTSSLIDPSHEAEAGEAFRRFVGRTPISGAVLCSVVPRAVRTVQSTLRNLFGWRALQLSPRISGGVGIDYPEPETIGQDRLANALAARHHFGAPVVVIDFGTAVTFDVVNQSGNYVGGIIAPGLAMMTDYLHEKTALLPKIRIRAPRRAIGRSTEQAMLAGAVYGYRGMVQELLRTVQQEMGHSEFPVVATGSYAAFMAKQVPQITAVRPGLTLEGLRLLWKWEVTGTK